MYTPKCKEYEVLFLKFHVEGKNIKSLLEMVIDETYIYCTSFDSVFSTARERQVLFYQKPFNLFPDLIHSYLYFSQMNLTCKWTKIAYSFMLFLQASYSVKSREIFIPEHTRITENKANKNKLQNTGQPIASTVQQIKSDIF